ncbi:hypothetical protein N0V83_007072 [Neocucurbitaria cava]|uniref:F-box domain-containing protein n=1 Tax=Neocucurbitaria cava TaxID=798079 RepID=A0A9W8Y4F0_9PLEO|nr:hypothetical protein N0V83_007072 [Neocucurbitaria cava]
MACLELLPAELQIQIFSYLHGPDVKAARGVSRTLRDNATPAIFRSIVACARYQAMGAYQKISLHSIYPKYVKEIIFDGSIYESILAKNYENAYYEEQDKIEELRFASHWEKRSRWIRYQELYKEQEDMKDSGVLLQTIARSLEWMPNVSSVVYSPCPRLIPAEAQQMRDLLPRGTDMYCTTRDHAFRQLIGAIYLSKYTGIREFKAEARPEEDPGTDFALCLFDFPETIDREAGRYLFQHLTKLELSMSLATHVHWSEMSSKIVELLANFTELLVVAKDMRHLTIRFPFCTLHPDDHFSGGNMSILHFVGARQSIFRHVGLWATWQKLRSLSLEGTHADEHDLTDFITRHKNTLSSLTCTKFMLFSGGTWANVVDEVVYNSTVVSFVLDLVNEEFPTHPRCSVGSNATETRSWKYQGHLVVSEDGKRNFVCS